MSCSGKSSIQKWYLLTLVHQPLNKKAHMNRFIYIFIKTGLWTSKVCSSPCRHRHTLCQSCIIHPFQQHNKQLVYFTLPIIEILKVVWLLIEWEIHVGGVLHHSSPPSTKRLWHISLEAPTASPLLSVHNLMAAVTAQLIHDGPLSSIPITSFSETLLIYMLDCSLTRCCHFLPSSCKWWKTF